MADIDQDSSEVKEDQSDEEQSKETETPSLEKVAELAQALQKGYTITRQELSEIKDNLQAIANSVNTQTGAQSGEDEYLTVGKLKEILSQQAEAQKTQDEQRSQQVETYIDATLVQLRADGVIKSKEDEDDFMKYAVAKKETDLLKAADRWQEVKKAREEGIKEAAKTKAKQEEGGKVGTSSKATEGEQGGIDYTKVKRGDWYSF